MLEKKIDLVEYGEEINKKYPYIKCFQAIIELDEEEKYCKVCPLYHNIIISKNFKINDIILEVIKSKEPFSIINENMITLISRFISKNIRTILSSLGDRSTYMFNKITVFVDFSFETRKLIIRSSGKLPFEIEQIVLEFEP